MLGGVNLQLPAGCVVAVVGESGAGKTTLVKLLSRYYEPSSGRITVDGIDLHRFDVDEWRRRMSAGFQDFVRFLETLAMSVGLGYLDHAEDRDDRRCPRRRTGGRPDHDASGRVRRPPG